IDTRVAFGRFRNARLFTTSINSFALVPADHAPALGETWTIEAWINPTEYGAVECNVIAARWTDQPNEQSWRRGLGGLDRSAISGAPPGPDLFDALISRRGAGLLVFAFQPTEASEPLAFLSAVPIEVNRWTHVAVTHDGRELRMYIDGRLDAQFASTTRVRDAAVPLVIGNQLDARWLTESQGPLQVPADSGQYPFYAFEGGIDEVRLTGAALRPGQSGRRSSPDAETACHRGGEADHEHDQHGLHEADARVGLGAGEIGRRAARQRHAPAHQSHHRRDLEQQDHDEQRHLG